MFGKKTGKSALRRRMTTWMAAIIMGVSAVSCDGKLQSPERIPMTDEIELVGSYEKDFLAAWEKKFNNGKLTQASHEDALRSYATQAADKASQMGFQVDSLTQVQLETTIIINLRTSIENLQRYIKQAEAHKQNDSERSRYERKILRELDEVASVSETIREVIPKPSLTTKYFTFIYSTDKIDWLIKNRNQLYNTEDEKLAARIKDKILDSFEDIAHAENILLAK